MNSKLIIGATAVFGAGLALGWAIGSDHQRQREDFSGLFFVTCCRSSRCGSPS